MSRQRFVLVVPTYLRGALHVGGFFEGHARKFVARRAHVDGRRPVLAARPEV